MMNANLEDSRKRHRVGGGMFRPVLSEVPKELKVGSEIL